MAKEIVHSGGEKDFVYDGTKLEPDARNEEIRKEYQKLDQKKQKEKEQREKLQKRLIIIGGAITSIVVIYLIINKL